MDTTEQKLDKLAEWQSQKDVLELQKQEAIAQVMTPEIKAAIDAINLEFSPKYDGLETNIEQLKEEIRIDVLSGKKTVPGTYIMAVYVKGREGGWDNGKLKGFAMAHPEIMAAKKPDGDPTVSFRSV